jgi:RNA-directed DNA polymerase
VQQSVSQILNNIWEQCFLPNSYGYRPNKSAHKAVHSLGLNLQIKGYGYIVEADIKGFFDNMNHDFVVAFQYMHEAEAFYRVLPKRFNKFGLSVAPEKTHLKLYSRFHPGRKRSFQFLGFEFFWSFDANKKPRIRRYTAPKTLKASMSEFYQWIKFNRSRPLKETMPILKRKLMGFQNYFGLPDNSRSLSRLSNYVVRSLYKWLNRRSQRRSYNWSSFKDMLGYFKIEPLRVSKRSIAVDWY